MTQLLGDLLLLDPQLDFVLDDLDDLDNDDEQPAVDRALVVARARAMHPAGIGLGRSPRHLAPVDDA